MPYRTAFALMGIPVQAEVDDPALLRAVDDAYAAWAGTEGDDAEPLRVRLRLASPGEADGGAIDASVEGPRLMLGGAIRGWADAARREAECAIPRTLLDDPVRLAAEVLDTVFLFLATRAGRIPLHASGIVVDGTAAVLAGPSGTGKSTLALAALTAGLPVLSDDTVYVQLQPRLCVWGMPRPIHVYPRDAGGDATGAMRLRSGRWKRAVPLSAAPLSADRAALFLLERGDRVALHRVDVDFAVDRVMAMAEPGFDHFLHVLPETVRALAAGGAWRLTLSANPADAVAAIRETLESSGGPNRTA